MQEMLERILETTSTIRNYLQRIDLGQRLQIKKKERTTIRRRTTTKNERRRFKRT